jgi:hypothetical protein
VADARRDWETQWRVGGVAGAKVKRSFGLSAPAPARPRGGQAP